MFIVFQSSNEYDDDDEYTQFGMYGYEVVRRKNVDKTEQLKKLEENHNGTMKRLMI